ncbi:DUF1674-domain-containing protein [Venturia nashicola]|nr:DUF1674-domain-containing protein [Venturia nashicola]
MSQILRPQPLRRILSRTLSSTARTQTSWSPGPAPPRLPKEEQELFEKLQKASTGAFSTPVPEEPSETPNVRAHINQSPLTEAPKVEAKGKGEELHPHIRRGAQPEFEGDTNPKTGEVGGPKNEPLRWGSTGNSGDWSYNGRVTDF